MSAYDPDRTDEAWHLLRKLFLLLLVVTALALGLVLLSRQKSNMPLVLFNILADASLGLVVGAAARLVLRGRGSFIQGLASAAVATVGLSVLGFFTGWQSGIGPFRFGMVPVHWLDSLHIALRLPLQFGASRMDLLDLAHIVIAMDTSWLALRVWKQGTRVRGQTSMPARRPKRPGRTRGPRTAAVVPASPAPRQTPVASASISGARIGRKKIGRPSVARLPIRPLRAKPARTGSRLFRQRPAVQLAVYEEHRCPYCLEPVNRNDARGVVECQVCHTLHHKDCWDITGNCQVPHLNA